MRNSGQLELSRGVAVYDANSQHMAAKPCLLHVDACKVTQESSSP